MPNRLLITNVSIAKWMKRMTVWTYNACSALDPERKNWWLGSISDIPAGLGFRRT